MQKGSEDSFSGLPRDIDQTHPWLLVSHGNELQFHTFYSVSKDEYIERIIPEFCHKQIVAASYGWLLLIDCVGTPCNCCLVNTVSKDSIHLPSIELDQSDPSQLVYKCVLSKPPTDPNCYVLLVPCSGDNLLFCRVGEEKFIERPRQFGDDYFAATINFKGKVYAWMNCSGNMVEVDFEGQDILLNQLVNYKGELYQIPWLSASVSFRSQHYLVESCGELLLVHDIGYLHSRELAYFRIFKIKVNEREWEELKNIGDRTIFLSSFGSMSTLCTDESRIKKNSIYFTRFHRNRNMYVYDIEERSKTLIKSCHTEGDLGPFKCWFML